MQFSQNSREFMNFFLNDVDNYLKKHNPKQQRQQDIIIKKLYTSGIRFVIARLWRRFSRCNHQIPK